MHKSATKCNETVGKWCKNKHGASKIIDTLETYHPPATTTTTTRGKIQQNRDIIVFVLFSNQKTALRPQIQTTLNLVDK
jgi:hypothetical protein